MAAVPRRAALGVTAVGLVAALGAVGGLLSDRSASAPDPALWTVSGASTVQTEGPAELAVEPTTYVPGQTSGWHSHPGLHLVTVVSGTLTVYGPDCNPARYGPGQSYIGGDGIHLARNEGDVAVEMGVTYLMKRGHSKAHFRTPEAAPPTCPLP